MKKTILFFPLLLAAAGSSHLFAADKLLKVIVEEANVYLEPRPDSYVVDIVLKGSLLGLLQKGKVRDSWYNVRYFSDRFQSRVSGFIHESYIEVVSEEKKEEPPPEAPIKPEKKEEVVPPPETQKEISRKSEEMKPKIEEKKEVVEAKEILAATLLPPKKLWKLPPREMQRQDPAWELFVAPVKKEIKEPVIQITLGPTSIPRKRTVLAAQKIERNQDVPWQILKSQKQEEKKELPVKKESQVVTPVVPERKQPKEEKKTELPKKEPQVIQLAIKPARQTETEKKEKSAGKEPQIVRPQKTTEIKQLPIKVKDSPPKRKLLTFGLGYGPSQGGAGGFVQVNLKKRISFHGGLGYYPTTLIYSETDWVKNKVLYSIGLKYYLPLNWTLFRPYLDLQYGGLRVEAAQIPLGVWDYHYIFKYEQKTLWGPSFLGGLEIRRGPIGLNAAFGLSYNTTKWEWQKQKIFLTFDASFIIDF